MCSISTLPTIPACAAVPQAVMKIFWMLLRQLRGQVELGQADTVPVLEIHPPGDGIGQRAHLLVDFLLHEMAVFALLGRDRVPGDAVDLVIAAA